MGIAPVLVQFCPASACIRIRARPAPLQWPGPPVAAVSRTLAGRRVRLGGGAVHRHCERFWGLPALPEPRVDVAFPVARPDAPLRLPALIQVRLPAIPAAH